MLYLHVCYGVYFLSKVDPIIQQGSHRSLKTWKVLEFENLDSRPGIFVEVLESPRIFVEVLESPGIWTYRSIFLIISIQECSCYTSSETWVYLCALKVREFIEKVLEVDIGRSWKVLESPGIWDVKMCINPLQ